MLGAFGQAERNMQAALLHIQRAPRMTTREVAALRAALRSVLSHVRSAERDLLRATYRGSVVDLEVARELRARVSARRAR